MSCVGVSKACFRGRPIKHSSPVCEVTSIARADRTILDPDYISHGASVIMMAVWTLKSRRGPWTSKRLALDGSAQKAALKSDQELQ